MIATPHKPPVVTEAGDTAAEISDFFFRFVRLAGPFWNSERKDAIRGMTLGLVVRTLMQVAMAVVVTEWSGGLFDALEQRSMSGLLTQIGRVVLVLSANMAITVAHLKIKHRIQLDWCGWLRRSSKRWEPCPGLWTTWPRWPNGVLRWSVCWDWSQR